MITSNQIRMARALLKWTVDDLKAVLEARDRKLAGETAPPDGLYLTAVFY